MAFYEWSTLQDFNIWHETKKKELGIPYPSVNQATGEIDESAQWTNEYTSAIQVEEKFIAFVEDKHAEGLTLTNLRPERPEIL